MTVYNLLYKNKTKCQVYFEKCIFSILFFTSQYFSINLLIMDKENIRHCLRLFLTPGIGATTFRRLYDHFGGFEAIFDADDDALDSVPGIRKPAISALRESNLEKDIDRQLRLIDTHNTRIIFYKDKEYPEKLREIKDFPPLLFVRGNTEALSHKMIAVVGTRKPTREGSKMAQNIGSHMARNGFGVASGMAHGIDSASHLGTLEEGGVTVAVLGCGADRPYPAENKDLMERIIVRGAVMSEFPMGAPPEARNFPVRNRIISGLSLGVVVVEAPSRSGALITAGHAFKHNRPVFAVPGNPQAPLSEGTNNLIKKGAILVRNVDDILNEITPGVTRPYKAPSEGKTLPKLSPEEQKVYEFILNEPRLIDDIADGLVIDPSRLSAILTIMELSGHIIQLPGKRFTVN